MKNIKVFISIFLIGSLQAMCQKRYPKNIYEAIKKEDQEAITLYAEAGQLNAQSGYAPDEFVEDTDGWGYRRSGVHIMSGIEGSQCLCYPSCQTTGPDRDGCELCCPPFPICCGLGIKRMTPLYYALQKKLLGIAKTLVGSGATLNSGKCTCTAFCQECCSSSSSINVKLELSSTLLAKLARRRTDAAQLLGQVVDQERPLLSGKNSKADEALCNSLLELNDIPLLQSIVEKKLISPAKLVCTISEKKNRRKAQRLLDHMPFLFTQDESGARLQQEQLVQATRAIGDQRIADMVLAECPANLSNLLQDAVNNDNSDMVRYLLTKNPSLRIIESVIPFTRSRIVAELLRQAQSSIQDSLSSFASQEPHAIPSYQGNIEIDQGEDVCPICRQSLQGALHITECHHAFHAECLRDWHEHTCPVCRKPM